MKVSVEKPGSPAEVLEHFGTKGMHWGVRKKQETSKSETSGWSKNKSTRVEKRAKGHDAQAHKAQTQIDHIRSNPSKWSMIQRGREDHARKLEQYRDVHVKAAKDLRAGHLTDHQKKVIIGASVVGVALVTYGSYKLVDSGTATQMLNRNSAFKTNSSLSRNMRLVDIHKEVVSPINPHYGDMGTKMNCRRATMAYEMRRRGMDVRATRSHGGTGQSIAGMLNATDPKSNIGTGRASIVARSLRESFSPSQTGPLNKAFNLGGLGNERINFGQHFISGKDGSVAVKPAVHLGHEKAQRIFETIGKHSDGARGELGVSWRGGGAHSMAWEIIHGSPFVIDAQTGTTYTAASFAESFGEVVNTAGITRLDNVELNTNFLKKWVTNA